MGLGAPEMMISDVLADPSNSTVLARANTYGYLAMTMVDDDGDESRQKHARLLHNLRPRLVNVRNRRRKFRKPTAETPMRT